MSVVRKSQKIAAAHLHIDLPPADLMVAVGENSKHYIEVIMIVTTTKQVFSV